MSLRRISLLLRLTRRAAAYWFHRSSWKRKRTNAATRTQGGAANKANMSANANKPRKQDRKEDLYGTCTNTPRTADPPWRIEHHRCRFWQRRSRQDHARRESGYGTGEDGLSRRADRR